MSANVSETPARRPARSSRSTLALRIVAVVVGVVIFAGMCFFAIVMFGHVSGMEFSPDTFACRKFVYLELPLARFRVSPLWHSDETGELAKYVAKRETLIPRSKHSPPRWHLVEITRSGTRYYDSADLLAQYFQMPDGEHDSSRWLAWTLRHPKLAEQFWPVVAELSREQRYVFIPDLFAAAEQASFQPTEAEQLKQFESAKKSLLARQFLALAEARRHAEKHQEAVDLFTAALRYSPENEAALSGRSLSYMALKEYAKANADRQQALKLKSG